MRSVPQVIVGYPNDRFAETGSHVLTDRFRPEGVVRRRESLPVAYPYVLRSGASVLEDRPMDLTIRCTCGALQGVARGISPKAGSHAVCYCDDCQAFAHFLLRAAEILDPQGGTEVFQMSPAALLITAGSERLACMRLSDRGLCRWYASCCNTPIGNTMHTSQVPFVGVVHLCIQRPAEDPALQSVLGPVQVRSFRRFAKGDAAALPADKVPMPLMVLRLLGSMLKWRLQGDHKHSPFFEPRTGKPITSPRVLSAIEREELRRRVEGEPKG